MLTWLRNLDRLLDMYHMPRTVMSRAEDKDNTGNRKVAGDEKEKGAQIQTGTGRGQASGHPPVTWRQASSLGLTRAHSKLTPNSKHCSALHTAHELDLSLH